MGVKRVLRYLKGTLKYGLKFTAQEEKPELFGYSDADWAGDVDTRRSASGYVFQLVELSAGQAGNNRQLPSPQLKLNVLL